MLLLVVVGEVTLEGAEASLTKEKKKRTVISVAEILLREERCVCLSSGLRA